ncbi:MAG: hypothetical protein GY868_19870 [Deltaproteobacteria bacterium]|nr:hypothetical protein [Deltaproteobacteria bacterium]
MHEKQNERDAGRPCSSVSVSLALCVLILAGLLCCGVCCAELLAFEHTYVEQTESRPDVFSVRDLNKNLWQTLLSSYRLPYVLVDQLQTTADQGYFLTAEIAARLTPARLRPAWNRFVSPRPVTVAVGNTETGYSTFDGRDFLMPLTSPCFEFAGRDRYGAEADTGRSVMIMLVKTFKF